MGKQFPGLRCVRGVVHKLHSRGIGPRITGDETPAQQSAAVPGAAPLKNTGDQTAKREPIAFLTAISDIMPPEREDRSAVQDRHRTVRTGVMLPVLAMFLSATENDPETWMDPKKGAPDMYLQLLGDLEACKTAGWSREKSLSAYIRWERLQQNYVIFYLAYKSKPCFSLAFYLTDFNKRATLRRAQDEIKRACRAAFNTVPLYPPERETHDFETRPLLLSTDIAVKIRDDHAFCVQLQTANGVEWLKLLDPVDNLNVLLKEAAPYGVKRRKWTSVTVATITSVTYVRIVTYTGFTVHRGKQKQVAAKVPCFVCHGRVDADSLVESSATLLKGTPVTFAWTPRGSTLWRRFTAWIKKKRRFRKPGDDAAREALYKWLRKCPAVIKSVSKYSEARIRNVLKSEAIDEFQVAGFWLGRANNDVHLSVTLVEPLVNEYGKTFLAANGDLEKGLFDTWCSFKKASCSQAVPPILLQRRYISTAGQARLTLLEDKLSMQFQSRDHKPFYLTFDRIVVTDVTKFPKFQRHINEVRRRRGGSFA